MTDNADDATAKMNKNRAVLLSIYKLGGLHLHRLQRGQRRHKR